MIWFTALIFSLISYFYIDKNLALYAINLPWSLVYLFKFLTILIAPIIHLILSICLTAISLHKKFRAYLPIFSRYLIGMLTIMFIAGILKIVVGRARPCYFIKTGFYGFSFMEGVHSHFRSFPSSHAATALFLSSFFHKKWPNYLLIVILVSSRIILKEHYLSDLIAGALLGVFAAKLNPILLLSKIKIKNARFLTKRNER